MGITYFTGIVINNDKTSPIKPSASTNWVYFESLDNSVQFTNDSSGPVSRINFSASGGGSASAITFHADAGSAASSGSILNLVSNLNGIHTSGSGNTITIYASTATISNVGVVQLATNAQAISGTDGAAAVTSAALSAKLGTQTAHGIVVAEGSTNALNSVVLTSGQLLIGSTGADPVAAALTQGTGISITSVAGSITISATGSGVTTVYAEDSGTATPNSSGYLAINGTSAQGIHTSGFGSTIIITASSASITNPGVVALATNAQAISGTDAANAVTSAALSAKLGTQTAHGIVVAEGSTNALNSVVLTSGQLLIGSTGADPIAAALTQGTGISITSVAGSITISATGSGVTTVYAEDVGTATPNSSGYLAINGTSAQGIHTSGFGSTIVITASSAGTTYPGVVELATNMQAISGTDAANAVTSAALSAKLGTQTANGILIGEGSTNALNSVVLTSGQLLIGSTGTDPVAAALTQGTGISITSVAGSITISATGSGVTTVYAEDSGTATPNSSGYLAINGTSAQGIHTSGFGSTIIITASSASITNPGVVALATNAQAISGTDAANAVTSAALSAKLGTQTANGILIGEGSTNALNSVVLTSGQLLIGSTGADPIAAALTQGTGISITSVAGSITISATGSGMTTVYAEDSGTATPNSSGFLAINGTSAQGIYTSGFGSTIIITASSAGTTYPGVVELATNLQAISGTDAANAVTSAALSAKLGTQTANGILIGEGSTNALNSVVLTSGQLLIGSTGTDPVAAALTQGTGISITSVAGSITISATGSGMTTVYAEDSGTATPNSSGFLAINGTSAQGIYTSGFGSTIIITASSAGTTYPGVVELATNLQAISGTDAANAVTSAALSAKLGTQTANGILIGEGSTNALNSVVLTSGQLLIGSTGTDPVAAALTQGTGISITSVAGSITISATGSGMTTIYAEDVGTATPNSSGFLAINGTSAQGIYTSGFGSTIIITASSASTTNPGVVELATNAQAISGTDAVNAVTSAALSAKLGTQTAHGIVIAEGSTNALNSVVLTSGQLLIGSTGGGPVAATLTAGSNITITNSPGGIMISSFASGGTFTAIITTVTATAVGIGALQGNTTGINNVAVGYNALYSNTTGQDNTAVGYNALYSNQASGSSTAVGYNALYSNTAGQITALGAYALYSNTIGVNNVAVGNEALYSNTIGTDNTAVGVNALYSNTVGVQNTAIGSGALFANVTSGSNTAVGFNALNSNTAGPNTAVGYNALYSNTTGVYNVALGNEALSQNTFGTFNTAIGFQALSANTGGGDNTAIGFQALSANTGGGDNTAVGYQALFNNTFGLFNTAVGNQALLNNDADNNTAVGWSALANNQAGTNNVAVGNNALRNNDNSNYNTAIGVNALLNNSNADYNTAVGYQALLNNNADYNTAVGYQALNDNMYGAQNTAVGYNALYSNMMGQYNTAVGLQALQNNNADYNTAVGNNALLSNTTGTYNVAVGYQALFSNTTGNSNTAIGLSALFSNQTGGSNTAVGYQALTFSQGDGNTAVGNNALLNNTTGQFNTAVGTQALQDNTSGYYNVAVGNNALLNNTTGQFNTAVGTQALQDNTSGYYNVAVGYQALLKNTTSGSSTALGYQALYSNTAGQNTAMGAYALQANTTGAGNVAIGNEALAQNMSGNFNTALGYQALQQNAENGSQNTAVGFQALQQNTLGGAQNTAVGYQALQQTTDGYQNTAMGVNALFSMQSGTQNTAVGFQAIYSNSFGFYNTAVGYNALYLIGEGSFNTAIGYQAGSAYNFIENNNICIGADVIGTPGENNVIRIGTVSTACFIAGIRGQPTGINDAIPVLVDGDGQLGTSSSSIRYKENIVDMEIESAKIFHLRPVCFNYKADATKKKEYGLIAEEVDEVLPEIVVRNKEGEVYSVQYHVLPVLLLNELKNQQVINREHKEMIGDLKEMIGNFSERIASQQKLIERLLNKS